MCAQLRIESTAASLVAATAKGLKAKQLSICISFESSYVTQVSWIRKRDLHILTSMSVTYTSDARFTIDGNPETDNWNLRIDYVQPRDAGIYECQVNTEPKIYRAVTLKVLGEFLRGMKRKLLLLFLWISLLYHSFSSLPSYSLIIPFFLSPSSPPSLFFFFSVFFSFSLFLFVNGVKSFSLNVFRDHRMF